MAGSQNALIYNNIIYLHMRNYLPLLLLLAFSWLTVKGQELTFMYKNEFLQEQIERTQNLISNTIFSQDEFINGKLYYPVASEYIHPFFPDNGWRSGMAVIHGIEYDIEPLKYDIHSDQLVYLHYHDKSASQLYLNKRLVKEFKLMDYHFVYLEDFGERPAKRLKPGYYELKHGGNTRFYIRREKSGNYNTSEFNSTYSERTFYFIEKKGDFKRIYGHLSFVKALNDHKKEMREFMKAQSFYFNKGNINSVGYILEYYDSL
jgi:hypothetical protein